jgi:hypothetical protein
MSKPKPLKRYTLRRTVVHLEFAERVAASRAEADRMAYPSRKVVIKITKWQAVGMPKPVEGSE